MCMCADTAKKCARLLSLIDNKTKRVPKEREREREKKKRKKKKKKKKKKKQKKRKGGRKEEESIFALSSHFKAEKYIAIIFLTLLFLWNGQRLLKLLWTCECANLSGGCYITLWNFKHISAVPEKTPTLKMFQCLDTCHLSLSSSSV